MGISTISAAMVPDENPAKAEVAFKTGELAMGVVQRGQHPRDIITKPALENAIAAVAMSGGSTNAVLHLMAVAHEAGVDLTLEEFDQISENTPLLCDLTPGGRYVAV